MHGVTFLQDLAVVMIVAGIVTILCHILKQPVVLGYIIAGVIIGPYTLPYPRIHDQETIKTLAELGIVFLMFSLGLEFSLRKLKQVGVSALIASFSEIILMIWLGYAVGRLFGWKTMDCIFLGAMLCIGSTTIIMKTLESLGRKREKFAELIFGILVLEDVLAIIMLTILSGVATTGALQTEEVLATVGQLSVFLVVTLILGLLLVPRLLGYVAKFKSDEMLLITVLGLCFGVSLVAVKLKYSVALGAFIIGAIIAEAREIRKVEALTEPMRDMFSAVFFVAIGLQINPALLVQYWLPILVIVSIVIVGKGGACFFGSFIAGNDVRTSFRVGMGLSQIGEFSFIIASLGVSLNITSNFLYPIAVMVSVVTTLFTPYLIRGSDHVIQWADRVAPKNFFPYLETYTHWVSTLGQKQKGGLSSRLLRRWLLQIGLNLGLVSGVFIVAAFFGRRSPQWVPPTIPMNVDQVKGLLWLSSVILTLPSLIAAFRKMEALGILISEMSVSQTAGGKHTANLRALITRVILFTGTVGMGLFVLLLSSTILPSFKLLMILLLILTGITVLLWRSFIKIYAKAQFALEETLNQPVVPHVERDAPHLPSILKNAKLATIHVRQNSAMAGKLISETRLRTATGVSIVGIERDGESIINPSPDEELRVDDQVLLLGSDQQIEKALALLNQ